MLLNHPNGSFSYFGGVPSCPCHDSILFREQSEAIPRRFSAGVANEESLEPGRRKVDVKRSGAHRYSDGYFGSKRLRGCEALGCPRSSTLLGERQKEPCVIAQWRHRMCHASWDVECVLGVEDVLLLPDLIQD